jgi:hypothetical protein
MPARPPCAPLPRGVVTWQGAAGAPGVRAQARMRWFEVSATYSVPLCHTAEVGALNCAAVPRPLANPALLPARVVVAEEEVLKLRTLWPPCSTMKMTALGPQAHWHRARPVGPLNWAAVPMPFAPPAAPLPARVETRPEGRILRTRWLR